MTPAPRAVFLLGAIALATLLVASTGAIAQRCGPAEIGWIGGEPRDVEVVGEIAYVAQGDGGVRVLDLSDVRSPRVIASVRSPRPGQAVRLCVDGDRLYVAARGSFGEPDTIFAVDVSDPATPRVVGTLAPTDIRGAIWDMGAASGRLVILATQAHVLDVRDPARMRRIETIDVASPSKTPASDLGMLPGAALVATGEARLRIVDLAAVPSPWLPSAIDPDREVGEWRARPMVEVEGDRLYTLERDGALSIRKFSEGGRTSSLGVLPGFTGARSLSVADDRVFIARSVHGPFGGQWLSVVDASDPSAPREVERLDLPGWPSALDASPTRCCAMVLMGAPDRRAHRLLVMEAESPSVIVAGVHDEPDAVTRVARDGDLLFALEPSLGMHVVDASDPRSPVIISAWRSEARPWDVDVRGPHAFVVSERALHVLDVADPTGPSEVASATFPSSRYAGGSISLADDVALIGGDGNAPIDVIDIRDPVAPRIAGSIEWAFGAGDIAFRGTIGFAPVRVSGMANVVTIDLSDPAAPVVIGTIEAPGRPVNVALAADRLFVASRPVSGVGGGVQVIDVANPARPRLTAFVPLEGLITDIEVEGERLVVAASDVSTLTILDISEPDRPTRLASVTVRGFPEDASIEDGLAVVAAGSGGLRLVQIGAGGRVRTSDLTGDGRVDANDVDLLIAAWGNLETPASTADLNADGRIDQADLVILLSAWGDCP